MRIRLVLLTLWLILLLFAGCMEIPEDVNAPEWNTELNLPLTNRHYTLEDLIEPDDYISIDSANGFIYRIKHGDQVEKEGIEKFIEGRMDDNQTDIEIPIANGTGSAGLKFPNGLILDSAYFSGGLLIITIQNNSDSPLEVKMTIPGFLSASGDPFSNSATVNPQSNKEIEQSLSGYSFSPSNQSMGPDSLEIEGEILSGDVAGSLTINYSLENTLFAYIAGVIPPVTINPTTREQEMPITDDVEDFRDKVKLFDVQLKISSDYFDALEPDDEHSPFDYRIDTLKIFGLRENKTERIYLKLNDRADNNLGSIVSTEGSLEKIFDESNSNISEVLSFMPEDLGIYAVITVNPEGVSGAATSLDSIQFAYDIEMTSAASVSGLSVVDTLDLEMEDDARESVQDFRAATINFKIDNAIAFGGKIIMDFADEQYNPLFTLDTVSFAPADLDADGIPIMRHSEPVIELDSAQIYHLSNSNFIIMNLIVNSSGAAENKKAVFTSKDWLDIISFCRVVYHIDTSD